MVRTLWHSSTVRTLARIELAAHDLLQLLDPIQRLALAEAVASAVDTDGDRFTYELAAQRCLVRTVTSE